jgi:hypothetical protein
MELINWTRYRVHNNGEVAFCCPFCSAVGKTPDTKYHLHINPIKGVYHCFRCDNSGLLISIVDSVDRIDWLQSLVGAQSTARLARCPLPESLPVDVDPLAIEYLNARGVDEEVWRSVGVRIGSGKLEGMLLFPCVWRGEVVYWTARRYTGEGMRVRSAKGKKWPFFNLRNYTGELWLVEGVFDLLHNDLPGLALLGQTMSKWWESLVMGLLPKRIIVALDADAIPVAKKLAARLYGLAEEVYVVQLPDGDPAMVAKSELISRLERFDVLGGIR